MSIEENRVGFCMEMASKSEFNYSLTVPYSHKKRASIKASMIPDPKPGSPE